MFLCLTVCFVCLFVLFRSATLRAMLLLCAALSVVFVLSDCASVHV